VLQPVAGGPGFRSVAAEPDARSAAGLVVYRFAGSLYYANAEQFDREVTGFVTSANPPAWVCLDLAAMPDIDITGEETIRQVYRSLADHGVHLVMAEPMSQVRVLIDRYGLTELFGPSSVYGTVMEAVNAFRAAGVTAPRAAAGSSAHPPSGEAPTS
ncbi:MAG TPA: sodium-independent anion transporter, partial [Acidimicrobiales bacterium]|nr:sodium-independent anion transporter [Acidimicrobiales bacterium]